MAGIVQNGEKCLIFIVVPQVRTKLRDSMRIDKSKESTLIYIHTYKNPRT